MQGSSHRLFNGTFAVVLFLKLCHLYIVQSYIVSLCIILFSSFPDFIERFGLKHRGVSHSLLLYGGLLGLSWVGLLCGSPNLYWASCFVVGLSCASLLHIVADMFSSNGIKLFNKSIRIGLYTTGKQSEQIFLLVCVILVVSIMYLTK
jgi:membrane-bound metal-dependent hydrolase YbcI (DUF457 family)